MKRPWHAVALLLILASFSAPAFARPANDPPPPVELRIAPVAVVKPTMTHPLLPEVTELSPGDAAQLYLSACLLSAQARAKPTPAADVPPLGVGLGNGATPSPATESDGDRLDRLLYLPASELATTDARVLVERYRNALDRLDDAARRETCRWERPAKQRGFRADSPYLPELAFLVRVLALDARLDAIDGRREVAWQRVRTGMAIAAHLASQPTLVHADVAAFAADQVLLAVEDLAASPGTPNLYWSLASLPAPLIDPRGVARWERSMLEMTVPGIARAAAGEVTPERWDELLASLRDAKVLPAGSEPRGDGPAGSISGAVATARDYVLAKRDLAARPGFGSPAERIDTLPISYVIGVSQYARYRDACDDLWNAFQLPARDAYGRLQEVQDAIQASVQRDGFNPFLALLPDLKWSRFMSERGNRRVATLRATEALRDYAASHDGRLPAALRGVDGLLPIPDDPATGGPFGYAVDPDGRAATLRQLAPPGVYAREFAYRLTVVGP